MGLGGPGKYYISVNNVAIINVLALSYDILGLL